MPKKRLGAEQFVTTLRQVEVLQSQPSCRRPCSRQLNPTKPTLAVNENTCTRANSGDKSGTMLAPRRFEAFIGRRDIGNRNMKPSHAAGTRIRADAPDLQHLDLVRFYRVMMVEAPHTLIASRSCPRSRCQAPGHVTRRIGHLPQQARGERRDDGRGRRRHQ